MVSVTPIGEVKSNFETNTPAEEMRQQHSQLVIAPEFLPGLLGLEPGMDVVLLFYLHRIEADEIALQLHPRHDSANPLAGVFATRTQFRPSKLGVTVARIELIDENVITVSGLDAQDGSPLIDIKPYTGFFDADYTAQQLEVYQVRSLDDARGAIDRLDTEIIRLLGNRAKFVHQVVQFKKRPEDVPAEERYNQVMRHRRELAQQAGLNPDVIEAMYKLLIDNFIQEELEIMRQRDAGQPTH